MIIQDKFVFLHNCHCGGHSVRSILQDLFPSAKHFPLESGHWHKPIRALYKDDYWGRLVEDISEEDKSKVKFGFVRNPWDWYVSFYYHQKPEGRFYKIYTDNNNNSFDFFLRNLLSKDYNSGHKNVLFYPPGDPNKLLVPKCKILSKCKFGFFSYRFIYTFCKDSLEILNDDIELSPENLYSYLTADDVLQTEHLIKNLLNFLLKYGIEPENRFGKFKLKIHSLIKPTKIKKSSLPRKKNHYSHYYDDVLKQLVYEKDKLLIDYFKYKFDEN